MLDKVLASDRRFINQVFLVEPKPFKPAAKFIDDFCQFVSVGCRSQKNLAIVLSDQGLRRNIVVFNIRRILSHITLGAGFHLRTRSVKIILLGESLVSRDRLLKLVLQFAEQERSLR